MPQNTSPEPTTRLAKIVASAIEDDVLHSIAADESDEGTYAFLRSGESFDAYAVEDVMAEDGTQVVYLVAREPRQEQGDARLLVRVTVEAVRDL